MTGTPKPTGEALQALLALKAIEQPSETETPADAYSLPRHDDTKERAWIAAAHATDKQETKANAD